jgi:hypothetical protein
VSLKNRMTVEFICRANAPILIQSIALTDQDVGRWQLQKPFIANYSGKIGILWARPEDAAGKFKPVDAATCKETKLTRPGATGATSWGSSSTRRLRQL